MVRVRLILLSLLFGCAAFVACQTSPEEAPQEPIETGVEPYQALKPPYLDPLFSDRAPENVAILAIRERMGLDPNVTKNLRAFVYDQMLRKGYAPLSPEFVDRTERESGVAADQDPSLLKDKFPSRGYLICSISLLDAKSYAETKQVLVQGGVTLYASGTGTVLFEMELRKQVRPLLELGSIKPGQSVEEAATERFFAVCLEQLPPRPAKP